MENGKRDFDEKKLPLLANVFSVDLESLRKEYFSDLIAKKVYASNCPSSVFALAEEKVKYLKQKRN